MHSQPPPCQQFILGLVMLELLKCREAPTSGGKDLWGPGKNACADYSTWWFSSVIFLWISYLVEMMLNITFKNQQFSCYHEGSKHYAASGSSGLNLNHRTTESHHHRITELTRLGKIWEIGFWDCQISKDDLTPPCPLDNGTMCHIQPFF